MDYLLDKSVIFSFDKSGFERHARGFDKLAIDKQLGRVLITGGSSGIGKACADFLLGHDNRCIVTGRDSGKFEQRRNLESHVLDLSDWPAVVLSLSTRLPFLTSGEALLLFGCRQVSKKSDK